MTIKGSLLPGIPIV